MPAPVGPIGPAPTPLPPHVPTATQPFLSQATPEAGVVRPVANSGPAAAGYGWAQAPAPADVKLTGGETVRGWGGPTASPLSGPFLPPASPPIRPQMMANNPTGRAPAPAPTRP